MHQILILNSDCRGFSFVTFVESKAADAAVEKLNGTEFMNETLTVEISRRKKGRRSTPGRYLGRFKGNRDGGRGYGGRRR